MIKKVFSWNSIKWLLLIPYPQLLKLTYSSLWFLIKITLKYKFTDPQRYQMFFVKVY